MPAEPGDPGSRGGGGTQLPLGQLQRPPHRCVFVLKEGLSSGFSKQLPRAVQLGLRDKLKQAVLPGSEEDERQRGVG